MSNGKPTEEMTLTFSVPGTDFDCIYVETALVELEKRVQLHEERYNRGLRAAYDILHKLHTRYVETLGKPEWRRPHLFPEQEGEGIAEDHEGE